MGGEKLSRGVGGINRRGLPPRRRGKVDELTLARLGRMDHPRAGGEKSIPPDDDVQSQGSPPRRRGKVERVEARVDHHGITPAQAGKSQPFG